jgi:SAM-dependent methyltransferase
VQAISRGLLVRTLFLDTTESEMLFDDSTVAHSRALFDEAIVVEHERVAVRSFPYEWPPEMLHAAGALMLDLAESALAENFSLKDATPYNVLFRGASPIFVDLLSFEPRDPCDPTWLPLNQFTRTILLPLLVNKYFGLRLDQLLTVSRDGLEPSDVIRLCGPVERFSPPFLSLVSLPHWLGKKQLKEQATIYQPKRIGDPARARFILQQQFKRLRRQLARVKPQVRDSGWSDYMSPNKFFSQEYLRTKEALVAQALEESRPKRVLDIGCNTGHFSLLAARAGATVVAVDQDPVVVGTVWGRAVAEDLEILPLVVNLARPTPATGWRNEECPSFLDRMRGECDAVLMLAVLHHLLVSEQIPLQAVLELAAELTSDLLIIEFISPGDPMFRHIARGRDELFEGLTQNVFEEAAIKWFELVRAERLNQTRWLYVMRKRNSD